MDICWNLRSSSNVVGRRSVAIHHERSVQGRLLPYAGYFVLYVLHKSGWSHNWAKSVRRLQTSLRHCRRSPNNKDLCNQGPHLRIWIVTTNVSKWTKYRNVGVVGFVRRVALGPLSLAVGVPVRVVWHESSWELGPFTTWFAQTERFSWGAFVSLVWELDWE